MQLIDGTWIYSASDLNNALECEHLTRLEERVAQGAGSDKRPEPDDTSKLLSEKGQQHERQHLEKMRAYYGAGVVAFPDHIDNTTTAMQAAEDETLAAMAGGAGLIYQATFFNGTFLGRADFLRRIDVPSAGWSWSYEVLDTKLALEPKPYFLIQLCNYSEHVARLQGTMPESGYVILGSGKERRFKLTDYLAYYRHQRDTFLAQIHVERKTYPQERAHCSICRWADVCEKQRDEDDYLGLVAFMRSDQIEKLATSNITTIAQLAAATPDQRPRRMSEKTFFALHAQADLQHRARQTRQNGRTIEFIYDFVDQEHQRAGFAALPVPDEGDVFFDMEGDPLYAPDHPLEYLFGLYLPQEDEFVPIWALSDRDERKAFEAVIDFFVERQQRYPKMHVYHYAPYEKTALRRLSGRYASRKDELDNFLKEALFVDLYHVVRQSLRISQDKYSIKMLEPFYGMKRETDVRRGDDSIVRFEAWLSSRDEALIEDIRRYNEDDCRSTYRLRQWLLERRSERIGKLGREIPWRTQPEVAEEEKYVQSPVEQALLEGVPEPLSHEELRAMDSGARTRWLLGHLIEYHRRESKSAWWKLFDRCENPEDLLDFDDEALGDLQLLADVLPDQPTKRHLPIYTYEYPEQEHRLEPGDQPYCPYERKPAGRIVDIDEDHRRLRFAVARSMNPAQIRALIPGRPLNHGAQAESLERIAQLHLDGVLTQEHPAVFDLLSVGSPRIAGIAVGAAIQPTEVTAAQISGLVCSLDNSYLVVQGPPGSGKTTIGAAVIVDLLKAKKRVGIMAQSHRAVHNLLRKIEEEAHHRDVRFKGLYKHSGTTKDSEYSSSLRTPFIESLDDNDAFEEQSHDLAAGTAWLFARSKLIGRYDYLFIDEAGQIALGDAVACAPCARNVVLLGDPRQLPQVSQGSHPVGTGLSILEHLLGEDQTVRSDRGVFLDVSYRMHPKICNFISEAIYEGRLTSEGTEQNAIASPVLSGSGLRYFPVEHQGNARESPEEAEVLVREIRSLLGGTVRVGTAPIRPIGPTDILVVTPYNRQRLRLQQTLAAAGIPAVDVGTVDKFQGREAAVVFYSMATSSGDDLPRDVRFLFHKNRLNVALSRAQCMTILVCSSRLLDISCSTPEQMSLVNLLCRFVEFAIH